MYINKISIIGCGWLGFPLAERLIAAGFSVKGSTTTQGKIPLLTKAGIRTFLIHLSDALYKKTTEPFFQSELLIINVPPRGRRPDVETAHPLEIKKLLEAAHRGDIQKIIFCSSTGVYGNDKKIASEDHLPHPASASGRALVKVENHLRSLTHFKSTIVRLAGLVGGERKPGRFLAGKENIPNGNAPVNLVYREDCIEAILQIILQNKWNEIYNVCADEHPTRRDFYTEQAKLLGLKPPSFSTDRNDNDNTTFKVVANEKIKRDL
ncbi:MAG: SDR family oxidoreductase, partial [Bacteroidota bacterium]